MFPGAAHASITLPSGNPSCIDPRRRYAGRQDALSCSTISPMLYAWVLVSSTPGGKASKSGTCSSICSIFSFAFAIRTSRSEPVVYPLKVVPSCSVRLVDAVLTRTHLGCSIPGPSRPLSFPTLCLNSSTVAHLYRSLIFVNSAFSLALCLSTASRSTCFPGAAMPVLESRRSWTSRRDRIGVSYFILFHDLVSQQRSSMLRVD